MSNSSIYNKTNIGDNTPPCLTSLNTLNVSEFLSLHWAQSFSYVYKNINNLHIIGHKPLRKKYFEQLIKVDPVKCLSCI
jgi:hypothetical protein